MRLPALLRDNWTSLLMASAVVYAAYSLPKFVARLFRPHGGSARMGISENTNGGIVPAGVPEGAEKCTVAAGCFWGVEHIYRKHFGNGKGLYDARVGYIGGDATNPTYRAVCSGRTGHTEALQIHFDPSKVSYAQLLEFFYRMHDPTTANRQGPDAGSQYRSGIYFHNEEQERIAKDVTRRASDQWYAGRVVTEVLPAGPWWDAEDYHQLYLNKNPWGYECPSHFLRPFEPLAK